MSAARTPLQITYSVWKALFLREAVNRVSRERFAWVWVLVEPIVHIAFLMFLFATVRVRVVGGIDTVVWITVGLLAFFMFRRPAQQGMNAVAMNQALFGYRQVKPVDAVLVRAGLEGFLMLLISIIVLTGADLSGYHVIPGDPMAVMVAVFGMWLIGMSFGLCASVASELVPELGRFIGLAIPPLYFLSGVIFPLAKIPPPYRDWLLLNPLVHGLEAVRLGFAPHYQALPETSIPYIYAWALIGTFLGLALHLRFARRLAAR
jgi:capsular polysaccharide transport system permease protein